MKAVVAAFNQEKALVGAFSVIMNLRMELFEALIKVPRVQECVHWDIQSHRWVSGGNQLVASNSTHSTCHFSYLSTYAVIRAQVSPLYLE